jgi:hypothetical protein
MLSKLLKLPREAREIFKPKFQSGAEGLFQNANGFQMQMAIQCY